MHSKHSKYHGLGIAIEVLGFEIGMLKALIEESTQSGRPTTSLRRILNTRIKHLKTAIQVLKKVQK